jgi:hypothetical protein
LIGWDRGSFIRRSGSALSRLAWHGERSNSGCSGRSRRWRLIPAETKMARFLFVPPIGHPHFERKKKSRFGGIFHHENRRRYSGRTKDYLSFLIKVLTVQAIQVTYV